MATAVLAFVGKQIAGAAVNFALKKALGIELDGHTVGAWGEQVVLGLFFGGGLVPGPTQEQQIQAKFDAVDAQLATIKQEISSLQSEADQFSWHVATLFLADEEQDHWSSLLRIENSADAIYARFKQIQQSPADLASKKTQILNLATNTVNDGDVAADVNNIRQALLGAKVSNAQITGLLDIWREQALREADLGASGSGLAAVYRLIRDKFIEALLIQGKCGRLLADAMDALHTHDGSCSSAQQYYASTFYPVLVEEVQAFRNVVESLAVNLLPPPPYPTGDFPVPPEIAGMLAQTDAFVAQMLSGRISDQAVLPGGLNLPNPPALSGCWGRFFIPGSHWIGRTAGSSEAARVVISAASSPKAAIPTAGKLELRAAKYTPEVNAGGSTMNQGYVLWVGGEARQMNSMLVAHFQPTEILPSTLSGIINVSLQDSSGVLLGQTLGDVSPLPVDTEKNTTVPFGSFSSMFTGGMDIRSK